MYLISSIASCYILNHDLDFKDNVIYLDAVLFHIVALYLLLKPLQKYDNIIYNSNLLYVPNNIINIVTGITIILPIICILNAIPKISFSNIMNDVGALRALLVEQEVNQGNVFIRYSAYYGGMLWSSAIVLFFYNLAYHKSRRILILLLLICSFSNVISGLVFAAREYLIKYLFLFIAFFLIFRNELSKEIKKRITIFIIISGILFLGMFLLITILRFENRAHVDTISSLCSYTGQGFIYFSEYFNKIPNGIGSQGRISFSFFVGDVVSAYNIGDSFYTNVTTNIFSTTIGSWILDVGITITIFIVVLHNWLFRRVANSKKNIFSLLYVAWIYEFIFSTIFFYNESLNGGRVMFILSFVILDKYVRFVTSSNK